jgi:hypothetical protein
MRSSNHCCSGKATGMTYSECASVALVIQHAGRMRHIVICGLSGFTIFFHIISQTVRLSILKKMLLNRKYIFWIFSTSFVRNISNLKRTERGTIKTFYWSLYKVTVIRVRV